jgi:hypothetical protein
MHTKPLPYTLPYLCIFLALNLNLSAFALQCSRLLCELTLSKLLFPRTQERLGTLKVGTSCCQPLLIL